MTHIKDVLKKHKVSLNDYIVCAASLALSKIATASTFVQVSMPFTLKDYPQTVSDLKIGNDFAALPFRLTFPVVRELSSFRQMLHD